jgi:phosphomethylpyrimidine synthase
VNANIGTSPDHIDLAEEVEKAKVAIDVGADAVMDLSTGGDLDKVRRDILKACTVPLGTVPIYQAAIEAITETGALVKMTTEKIFEVIERQAQDGVDFMTLHCGVTQNTLQRLKHQGRVTDIVSRGGVFLTTWMIANNRENPLYEDYDRLLAIAEKYDITLSLGDGLRPGSLADATDQAQIGELVLLGELAQRAWKQDVQAMIEGPGHLPLDQVEYNVLLEKRLCRGAPFYVLGPVVTDIAPGYDHITSAIGGAWAAAAGADFLCYVTPGEHLRLPKVEDVREGVIVTRIAAHAADIVKGVKGAVEWDHKMAQARKDLNWEEQIRLSVNPELARKMREESSPRLSDVCTMCGEYCALKLVKKALHPEK